MKRRLNVLVVVHYLLKPDTASGDLRLFSILEMLAKDHQVDMYVTESEKPLTNKKYGTMLDRIGVKVGTSSTEGLQMRLAQRLYDIVIFEFWMQAAVRLEVVRKRQPWAKLIVDSVDVHFLREEAALAVGKLDKHSVESNKRHELDAYRQADGVIVVTEEDGKSLELYGDMPSLYIIPNVLSERSRSVKRRDPELLFVGGICSSAQCACRFGFL
jgi:hypothetical protein